ncbi:hypothetical protein [Cardinium endosymbiont of Sogatella furcifera]|uniref:hypothetical protein n=1 Tax=Cardinium endosymbiont of Sogatella furcifera TaxID=650378 RepID=UPI000E0E0765|nr:hypothetical protein [Cardinium endosymbiont of Sogatella furcifera]
MNLFKKSIAFLTALSFMPSPKVAAEELHYGIRIGGANSFMILPRLQEINKELQNSVSDQSQGQAKLECGKWNPWFAAALYMEYAFNDHIGLGMEVLYSRFDCLMEHQNLSETEKCNISTLKCTHTIGLPVLFTWYWTALICPDFKKNYFLGRLFVGLHSFYLVKCDIKREMMVNGEKTSRPILFNGEEFVTTDSFVDEPFNEGEKRLKYGFIYGTSLEFPSGLLLEIKGMAPYNFCNVESKKNRPNVHAFHLSVGYNFAKLYA